MSELVISPASPSDAAALLTIYAPYVLGTAITFEYDVPGEAEFAGRIAATLARYPYLTARDGGVIVGYAYAGPFKDRPAYDRSVETTIYVRRDLRRRGTGRALYAALEYALRRRGILNLNACVAYPDPPDEYLTRDSVAFHEALGYVQAAHFHKCGYKFGRWYDMVWLEKLIGEHRNG